MQRHKETQRKMHKKRDSDTRDTDIHIQRKIHKKRDRDTDINLFHIPL